jgi:ABC-type amino acid transport substrate-binding protein
VALKRATAEQCLADLVGGRVDGFLDDAWAPADLVDPRIRILPDTPFVEQFAIMADRSGPDSTDLLAALDQAISAMRLDGTLARFAASRGGALDIALTPPQ